MLPHPGEEGSEEAELHYLFFGSRWRHPRVACAAWRARTARSTAPHSAGAVIARCAPPVVCGPQEPGGLRDMMTGRRIPSTPYPAFNHHQSNKDLIMHAESVKLTSSRAQSGDPAQAVQPQVRRLLLLHSHPRDAGGAAALSGVQGSAGASVVGGASSLPTTRAK